MKSFLISSSCSGRLYSIARNVLAVLTAITLLSGSGRAQEQKEVDLTGEWTLRFTSPNGDKIRIPVKFRQEGENLTGLYTAQNQQPSPLEDGSVKGDQVTFAVTRQRDGRRNTAKYSGKIERDQITGTFESNFGGTPRTLKWEAQRKKEPVDASGTWKWTFTRDDGQPMEFTLKLKEENHQLEGVALTPGGNEIPILDGSTKNDELTFKLIRERDDRKFTTAFRGKRSGDTITGKLEADWTGEIRSYDWTAKRIRED